MAGAANLSDESELTSGAGGVVVHQRGVSNPHRDVRGEQVQTSVGAEKRSALKGRVLIRKRHTYWCGLGKLKGWVFPGHFRHRENYRPR